jgi:hypothetical protein
MEKILFINYHINVESISPNDVQQYVAAAVDTLKLDQEATHRLEMKDFLVQYNVFPTRHGESRMSIICIKEDGTVSLG